MSEFKVGDRVSLLDNDYIVIAHLGGIDPFDIGKTGTITRIGVNAGPETVFGVLLDEGYESGHGDNSWAFYPHEIEKVEGENV